MSTNEPTHSMGGSARPGARLIVFWDSGAVSTALNENGTIVIGRGEDVDVRVDHPSVSRRHAALHLGPPLQIEDLGSANGTRVRGRALPPGKATELASGELAALGEARLMVQVPARDDGLARPVDAATVVGTAMRSVYATADRMASSNISILLLGETGVGKEVLATHIHEASGRTAPFLRLNCAAVSESLVESELFGHEKGAFTGAIQAKLGLLEAATGGTVLLDEIGDLPIGMQSKLLRALENQQIFRVGGVRPIAIDVRFLAATSRDLHALVAQDRFRPDLYYRLGGAVLRIPPLRERVDEIGALAQLFVRAAADRIGRPVPRIQDRAVTVLERCAWPGNLRELRNVVERALLLASPHDIGPQHIVLDEPLGPRAAAFTPAPSLSFPPPPPTLAAPPRGSLQSALSELEKQRVLGALEACGGNQTRAAEMLGMRRATMIARLDAYGIKRPRRR